MVLGRPRGGFSWHSNMTWPDFMISAAEGIQEAIFEGDDFWGMPFPPSLTHGQPSREWGLPAQRSDGVPCIHDPRPLHLERL